jgi:hypothetical protein
MRLSELICFLSDSVRIESSVECDAGAATAVVMEVLLLV